jgi:hypothetical protein
MPDVKTPTPKTHPSPGHEWLATSQRPDETWLQHRRREKAAKLGEAAMEDSSMVPPFEGGQTGSAWGREPQEYDGPARQPSVPDRPPTGATPEREADDQAGLSDAARGFVSGVKRTSRSVDYEKGAPAAPLGVGLALIGAATLVVSAFLPWADVSNTGFSRLAKNTLVQHGDWFVLVAAAVICLDVYRCYARAGRLRGLIWVLWAPVVAVVLLVAEAAQKSHFQFYPIGAGGLADTSVPATAGSPGVGLYVGIVGAVVAAAGLVAMRRIATESLTETKRSRTVQRPCWLTPPFASTADIASTLAALRA